MRKIVYPARSERTFRTSRANLSTQPLVLIELSVPICASEHERPVCHKSFEATRIRQMCGTWVEAEWFDRILPIVRTRKFRNFPRIKPGLEVAALFGDRLIVAQFLQDCQIPERRYRSDGARHLS